MTNLISEVKANYERFNEEITERRLSVTPLTKMLLEDMGKLISAAETVERQVDEAVNALEWYSDKKVYEQQKELYDENNPLDFYYEEPKVFTDGGDYARKTIKRIKGDG